ncbi:MAG: diguanylate cyclase [Acidobacteriota bacterium]|jgi:diguanylate cyclase (GGDEF)-like protein|nr:MAG: hypothetical protein DIU54_09255 [Acidobacteriota bacterium]
MARFLQTVRATVAHNPLQTTALAAGYVVLGILGHRYGFSPPGTTLLWLPSGIALGGLLVLGYSLWPVVFGAAAVVVLWTGAPLPAVLLLAAGHTAESVLAAYLVNRYAAGRHALQNPRNSFRFAGVAVLAAAIFGATFNTAAIVITRLATGVDVATIWIALALGSTLGMLLMAPPIVLASRSRERWPVDRIIEVAALLLTVTVVSLIAFAGFPVDLRGYPTELLGIPVLLWSAFRLGQQVSAVALLVLGTVATAGTLAGYGPFVRATPFDSLVIVLLFVMALAVMTTALAAVSADYAEARQQLVELAVTDPMTGLANYRRLNDVIGDEIARARRHGRRFAVIFFDLDGLKRINDELGHLAGSRAVMRFAAVLTSALRTTDTAARYGGDEFVAVLPDTDLEGAALVVQRTHARLEEEADGPKLSVSAGIAIYPDDGHAPATLLSAADRALYVQKSAKKSAARRRSTNEVQEWTGAG